MYGIEFLESAIYVKIIVPAIILYGSTTTIISFFNGIGMASTIPKVQVLPIIIHLIISYFLLDKYGIVGGALAYSLGLILYSIMLIRKYITLVKCRIDILIPRRTDLFLLIDFLKNKLKLLL